MTAEGYVFDDLGYYNADEDMDFYEKTLQEMGIAPYVETREAVSYPQAASVGDIGGADGPTENYVTK